MVDQCRRVRVQLALLVGPVNLHDVPVSVLALRPQIFFALELVTASRLLPDEALVEPCVIAVLVDHVLQIIGSSCESGRHLLAL